MGEMILERGKEATQTRSRMGRPTKYSDTLAEAICGRLKRGSTRTAASEASGVNRDTMRLWMDTYPAFFCNVLEAEAEAEILFTQTLADAATGEAGMTRDWRAAETWLKRRRRADYGDTIDIRKVDADTLLQLLRLQQAENQTEPLALEAGDDAL